ncbi:MAG: hypothetical protein LBS86_00830 [Treponema sp.]|jgi:hypothetical protein|nr:hypothetical protein [Treponema sp.]
MRADFFEPMFDTDTIQRALERMIEYSYAHPAESMYRDYYAEIITELEDSAGALYEQLQTLYYRYDSGLFDDIVALLTYSTMSAIMDSDGVYDSWAEHLLKQKRRAALLRMRKEEMLDAITDVQAFIHRYLQLSCSFRTIEGVIDELDFHQSAVNSRSGVRLNDAAFV